MPVLQMNKEDFKTKIFDYENQENWDFSGPQPAVIDFYADWCGPCKMLSPVLEELAEDYAERVNFYKVNIDAEQELTALFGIRSVPSLLFVPVNNDPFIEQGALPKYMLAELINDGLLTQNNSAQEDAS